MIKTIKKIGVLYLLLIALFELQRLAFILVYSGQFGDAETCEIAKSLWAGLSLDASMAGYMTIAPLLFHICRIWTQHRAIDIAEKTYFVIISIIIATITVLDLGLYWYWGFRLDMTPIFYFMSSPAASLASATMMELILAPIAIIALSFALSFTFIKIAFSKSINSTFVGNKCKAVATATSVTVAGLLFIAIRGGVTVSTMNLSRAYYSQNQRLNHAAINPQFSLMYSATHQNNFKEQYRYFDEETAAKLFAEMKEKTMVENDSLLTTKRPDIYMIIAESFSAHLMPSLGGEPIAVRLDSIAQSGMLFTNFYASSFRTDRGIPAILSGFPAQPNTSLMKYVEKAENLPSLPKTLKANGYELSYYYGGDINFTNMLAYLVSQGFEHIIKDKDFTISERRSKWGAHDDVVFRKMMSEIISDTSEKPQLRIIQTSSSHEPFEVPFHKELKIKYAGQENRANAFAYADSCIADFVCNLRNSGKWENALVIITPDHYGAYPMGLEDVEQRHRIPLIFTGGALRNGGIQINTPACQTDIVATILSAMGIKSDEFIYSKNIFSTSAPHFAFFTEPEFMGILNDSTVVIYNLDADRTEKAVGKGAKILENQSKAYLQTIYNSMEEL